MLKPFLKHFKEKIEITYTENFYQDYFDNLGGRQFGDGLFNAFTLADAERWKTTISEAFPKLQGIILPIGYSWAGVCFCLDYRDGKIIVADIGADELFAIPCSLRDFLNKELPQRGKVLLQSGDYTKWRLLNRKPLTYGTCAGYRLPLFLNGDPGVRNREAGDLEVYWTVLTQVKAQVQGK